MLIKVSEASGVKLDWMVAKCEGALRPVGDVLLLDGKLFVIRAGDHEVSDSWHRFSPSTDWSQGGVLIEREGMTLRAGTTGRWDAELDEFDVLECGPTPLVAAMRCFVASKLGTEIEVPDETN